MSFWSRLLPGLLWRDSSGIGSNCCKHLESSECLLLTTSHHHCPDFAVTWYLHCERLCETNETVHGIRLSRNMRPQIVWVSPFCIVLILFYDTHNSFSFLASAILYPLHRLIWVYFVELLSRPFYNKVTLSKLRQYRFWKLMHFGYVHCTHFAYFRWWYRIMTWLGIIIIRLRFALRLMAL